MIFDDALGDIDKGRLGLNKGLSTGLPRTDELICGLQKGTYYLIGGDTGSGKSYFVNNSFLLNPLDQILRGNGKEKLHVIYLSFEMVAKVHILRAIPRKLWTDHGLITDVNSILSRGKNRISDEIYEKVKESKEYFEKIESYITFVDSSIGKNAIDKFLKNYAIKNGTFVKDQNDVIKYIPNDPDLWTVVILDHNGLSKKEGESSTKEMIDGISKTFVKYRNTCGFSFVSLNQFNRDIQSMDRRKQGAIEPQLSDFKDTSGSQEDADMVLALCDPWRYGYTTYKDFDINALKSYFRCLHILKNRFGDAHKHIGLNFFGNIGSFYELPRVKDMTQYDYDRAINLELRKPGSTKLPGTNASQEDQF